MQSIKTKLALMLAIGASLTAHVASAADVVYQSGSACAAGKNDIGKVNYSHQWGAGNENTTSTAVVYCPVVYDSHEYADSSSGDKTHVEVVLVDLHSSQDVSCSLLGVTPWTPSVAYNAGTQKTTGRNSTTPDGLTWFNLPNRTTYTLKCTLPPSQASGKLSRVMMFGTGHLD